MPRHSHTWKPEMLELVLIVNLVCNSEVYLGLSRVPFKNVIIILWAWLHKWEWDLMMTRHVWTKYRYWLMTFVPIISVAVYNSSFSTNTHQQLDQVLQLLSSSSTRIDSDIKRPFLPNRALSPPPALLIFIFLECPLLLGGYSLSNSSSSILCWFLNCG